MTERSVQCNRFVRGNEFNVVVANRTRSFRTRDWMRKLIWSGFLILLTVLKISLK